jgi:cytochrome P450
MLSCSFALDLGTLCTSVAAALVSFFVVRDVLRPLPPGVLAPKPLRRGNPIAFIMQHGFDVIHEEGFHILRRLAAWSGLQPVTYRVFFLQCIAVFHPQDVEYIFSTAAANFVKGPTYDILGRALGSGLITERNSEVHARHRRIANPAFSPAALERFSNDIVRRHTMTMYATLLNLCRQALSSSSAACGGGLAVVCMKETIHRLVLGIVAEAAFHTETPEETAEIHQLYHKIQQHLMNVWHITALGQALSPWLRRVDAAKASMDHFVSRLATRLSNSDDKAAGPVSARSAIIDYLLESKELSMSEIRDHAVTFMFTGLDTSSNAIQWILALLADHQDVQQELYEELCTSFMGLGSCPVIEHLQRCIFLTYVIKEGLRLYGVAAFIGRDALEDDVLPFSKIVIPKGSYMVVGLIATHRSKELYGADAEEFRPSRWADPRLEPRLGAAGFIPFSMGKRNCIGKDFAMYEMMIVLSVLVRNFKISFGPGQQFPKAQLDIILTPEPFKMSLSLRGE